MGTKLDLRTGTVVESAHHGKGTVTGYAMGGATIKFDGWKADKKKKRTEWAGAVMTYTDAGRYFTDGTFEDKKPVLKILSQPEPVPVGMEEE